MKKSFAWVTTSCVLVSQAVLCQGLLDQSTEAGCHTAGGKWAQVWLVDSGDNGMTLELTNTDTSVAVSEPDCETLVVASLPDCSFVGLFCLAGWLAGWLVGLLMCLAWLVELVRCGAASVAAKHRRVAEVIPLPFRVAFA